MGVSSDGLIAFGIPFEEDFQFPWGDESIEDWWIDTVCGFKPTLFPYTPEGEYIPEYTPEVGEKYYAERDAFKKEHPAPHISEENYCSGDYAMYMLCIKDSRISASRGYPTEIDVDVLTGEEELGDWAKILVDFCEKHGIELEEGQIPKWYLYSYMG